ncbi:MAG: DMT family transporter [Bacteroidota bacterium]
MNKSSFNISSTQLVWILVSLLALIWGSSYLVLKRALVVFSPAQVAAARMAIAAMFMLPIAIPNFRKIPRDKWAILIVFALMTNALITYLNALAQSQISSSLNGIVSALTPVMTYLIGITLYGQRGSRPQSMGLILGLAGSIILVFFGQKAGFGTINLFVLVAIGAAFFTGFAANMIRFNLQGLTVMQISSMGFVLVFPLALAYTLYSDFIPTALGSMDGQIALFEVTFLAILANVAGIILFTKLVEISNPVIASLVTYLVPVIALGWGIWDGELINIYQLIGMAIIILSVWIVGKTIRGE